MSSRMGSTARVIRVIAGLAILSLVFIGPKTNLGFIGIIPIFFGATGYCPACAIKERYFGCKTCGVNGKDCSR